MSEGNLSGSEVAGAAPQESRQGHGVVRSPKRPGGDQACPGHHPAIIMGKQLRLELLKIKADLESLGAPWLLRPSRRTAMALVRRMSGPGRTPPESAVELMRLVGKHVRTSLAPKPFLGGVLAAAGPAVAVVVGESDVFFPAARLAERVRALEGWTITVVPEGGHLLGHEHPEEFLRAARAVAGR
jgi:pimeloyl-ACP methyl ester carboxylesterase